MVNNMKDKLEQVMKERDYWLHSIENETIFHFCTPIGEEPSFVCDVKYSQESVEFRFRYLTKKCFQLSSDWLGCFFDDKHFKKFETNFWGLASTLYNYENK